jgi:hypothetical protein
MQSQRWHEKEKYEHDAELDKKEQDQPSEFFLVDFEEMRCPRCAGFPKQQRCAEIEQREDQADDKGGEEKVPEENNFLAVHVAIIYFSDARSITNTFSQVDSLKRCLLRQAASRKAAATREAAAAKEALKRRRLLPHSFDIRHPDFVISSNP